MGNCWAAQVDSLSSETTRLGSRGINESGHLAGNSEVSRSLSLDEVKPPKVYSYAELKSATSNFRADKALGEGAFGRVFQGWVDKKTYEPSKPGRGLLVAVKKMNSESFQGLEEWQSEVNIFGSLCHPNLVKLIGYCKEDKELLLVYEFMEGGSLQNHLFGKGSVQPLSWSNRLKIALGAACGLAFLHASEKQVIYRDVKTSNILLDAHFNSKLHSSGLAKSGPANDDDHVSTRVMGTFGYAAPEYIATGHLYVKSDVYSFGVVFLEMLTGLRTIDKNRRAGQHNLVDWAKPLLSERKKLMSIMDSRLEEQFPVLGAVQAAQLILKCIASDLKDRPSMKEVVETLEQIQLIQKTSNESKSGTKHPAGHPDGLNN